MLVKQSGFFCAIFFMLFPLCIAQIGWWYWLLVAWNSTKMVFEIWNCSCRWSCDRAWHNWAQWQSAALRITTLYAECSFAGNYYEEYHYIVSLCWMSLHWVSLCWVIMVSVMILSAIIQSVITLSIIMLIVLMTNKKVFVIGFKIISGCTYLNK